MTIPPIFALTCDELPGRKQALQAHLRERGLTATLFRAAHGKTWGLETSLEFDPGQRLPPGHVALNISSWFLWQHAYLSQPAEEVFVFIEDDAVFPADFVHQYKTLSRQLFHDFPDWDLVFLGTCGQEPQIWHKVTERIGGPDSRLCRLVDPFGTHAMMVRRRVIPVLLEHMRKAERNLDQQLYRDVLAPGHLKWCAVLPTLVTQRTYDHAGTGVPEWKPSTLRDETEAKGGEPQAPAFDEAAHEVATLAIVDPFPCIYRGESVDEPGRAQAVRRSVPLSECARMNVLCHSKTGVGTVLGPGGTPSTPCETCHHRLEMAPAAARERLPLPEGHFNPSIAMWDGKLVLATRDSWGHSKVALWELTNSREDWTGAWATRPIGSYGSSHPLAPRLEDPRLFTAKHQGRWHLHSMFSLPDGYPPKRVKVGYVRFASDLSGIEETVVMDSPHDNAYEKNWMPIWDDADNELRWVYSYKPNHVVLGGIQNWSTPNPLPWTGGAVRGGATPVYAVNYPPGSPYQPWYEGSPELRHLYSKAASTGTKTPVFYHFFHGCLKRAQGSVYTLGCNVFEARPPYRVLRQTATPLVWPDLPAPGESVVKRYVLWPGGAVPHAGAWHIAVGIDDTFCRIIRLPFATVEAALTDVPADRAVTSIRDTQIVTGVRAKGASE